MGMGEVHDPVWYMSGELETIEKIKAVTLGLDGFDGYLLGNVIKYCDRAGLKGDAAVDLAKAANYASMLTTGEWSDVTDDDGTEDALRDHPRAVPMGAADPISGLRRMRAAEA